MATLPASSERATYRTVILLRRAEKLKLEQLASKEKVSSAELIRRFIRDGEAMLKTQREEVVIEAALKIIATSVVEANQSMTRTLGRIDRLHCDLKERDIR